MIIYALYGKDSIGKTTVIKNVCEKLKADYKYINFDLGYEDVCYIFEINGKKVGITSYGDNADVLEKPFAIFEKENCDVILTASRIRYTETGSALFIKNFAKKYSIKPHWLKKDYIDTKTEQDKHKYKDEINSINNKVVDSLFDVVTK